MSRRPVVDLICALIFATITAAPAWWIYGPPAGVAVFAAAAALFLWVDT